MANTALRDYQFEILRSEDSNAPGVPFGIGHDISLNEDGFRPGDADYATQDSVSATRGHTLFGRDVLTGPAWSWALHADMEDPEGALTAAQEFRRLWGPPRVSGWRPQEITTLRYRIAGRTRRIYGRPRRYNSTPGNTIIGGHLPINADFKCVDGYVYDDVLSTAGPLTYAGTDSTGGFILPNIFPITPAPAQSPPGFAVVGGTEETFPIIRFNGPTVDPVLLTDRWACALDYTIPEGSYVIIDTRPWHCTALLNGTRSVAGKLARRTWLEDMTLRPGPTSFTFQAATGGGGSSATVSWRSAWSTL